MTTLTAAILLASNFYESTDFDPANSPDETLSLINVEYIIDKAISYVNSEAGTSITTMADTAGVAGAKSITLTDAQYAPLAMILPVMLKEAKYKISSSSALGPASVSESVGSQDTIFRKMFWQSIGRLQGRSFLIT